MAFQYPSFSFSKKNDDSFMVIIRLSRITVYVSLRRRLRANNGVYRRLSDIRDVASRSPLTGHFVTYITQGVHLTIGQSLTY